MNKFKDKLVDILILISITGMIIYGIRFMLFLLRIVSLPCK